MALVFHSGVIAAAMGAAGILILAVSNQWKFRQGVFLSIICIMGMAMFFIWQWVDRYALDVYSADIASKPVIFFGGLAGSFTLLLMVWMYERLLNEIHIRLDPDWFVKKSYVRFFKLLFYFQLFLLFFWIFAFALLKSVSITGLDTVPSVLVAAILALPACGITLLLSRSKEEHDHVKRHLRGRRHRHEKTIVKKV
jgi:hypothetical protein